MTAAVLYVVLHKTPVGRKLFSIGENRIAARYSGIRVDRFECLMFVLCGLLAAVSAIFYVGCSSATVRADAMQGYEMYAIAVAVLGGFSTDGGKGNVAGVVLSVVIFCVMKKGLGTLFGFSDSTVNLAVGIVLILASLRLGHGAALTRHRRVIHYRATAPLPLALPRCSVVEIFCKVF